MRLTATDPMGGTGLMGVSGMDEFCTVPVDNFPSVICVAHGNGVNLNVGLGYCLSPLSLSKDLISWIGKSVLLHFVHLFFTPDLSGSTNHHQAWSPYQRIFNRNAVNRQRQLKSEILLKKAELLQTSAQDQFAKWAKLRRSVDKGLADLEKLSCVFVVVIEFATCCVNHSAPRR